MLRPGKDSSAFRIVWRVVAILLWLIPCFPIVLLLWAMGLEGWRAALTRRFYSGLSLIVGLRVTVDGRLSDARPLMLVANHSSYADVMVLGALAPLSFTPKKEVRRWPLIGFLCVLADCVFVERKPTEMHEARAEMEKRLKKGKIICLFPEGTTSDGKHMKPFKSGFFSLAEQHALPVQPVTIAYTHIGTQVVTDARREEVAWIGDDSFFGHFMHMMGLPRIQAHLVIHPLQHLADFEDRKALAKACGKIIATSLAAELEKIHAG